MRNIDYISHACMFYKFV